MTGLRITEVLAASGESDTRGRVYIFLDESGNLDFSPKGTRYFVLAGVSTKRPFQMNEALDGYKYDCIEYGLEQEHFHCANDNSHVRNRVFGIICRRLDGIEIDILLVEKAKTPPSLTIEGRFYPEMLGNLLMRVLARPSHAKAQEIIIITDTIPLQRRRRAIEKAIKSTLAKMLPKASRYRILHHDSRSHCGLQVADYCCWAVFRRHEKGDRAYYNRIQPAVRSCLDIFRTRAVYYY